MNPEAVKMIPELAAMVCPPVIVLAGLLFILWLAGVYLDSCHYTPDGQAHFSLRLFLYNIGFGWFLELPERYSQAQERIRRERKRQGQLTAGEVRRVLALPAPSEPEPVEVDVWIPDERAWFKVKRRGRRRGPSLTIAPAPAGERRKGRL